MRRKSRITRRSMTSCCLRATKPYALRDRIRAGEAGESVSPVSYLLHSMRLMLDF